MRISAVLALATCLFAATGVPTPTSAHTGISVYHDGAMFYLSVRCYTRDGKHSVGGWSTNFAGSESRSCFRDVPAGSAQAPAYVRINRKTLGFRNFGSTWRVHVDDHCGGQSHMCVTARGRSQGSSRYDVHCGLC